MTGVNARADGVVLGQQGDHPVERLDERALMGREPGIGRVRQLVQVVSDAPELVRDGGVKPVTLANLDLLQLAIQLGFDVRRERHAVTGRLELEPAAAFRCKPE